MKTLKTVRDYESNQNVLVFPLTQVYQRHTPVLTFVPEDRIEKYKRVAKCTAKFAGMGAVAMLLG